LTTGILSAQQINIDEAVRNAARGVEDVLSQGTIVAVLNFASPTETFSEHVIEELTGELVMGRKLTIVDRHSLDLVRNELDLNLSGDVSDESAQAIGRMLGAQSIITGSLTNMGTFHRFRIRVINVETATIQVQVSLDIRNDSQLNFLLGTGSAARIANTNKSRVHIGGGFGVGRAVWNKTYHFEIPNFPYFYTYDEEESVIIFAPWVFLDFAPLPFFAIELGLGLGLGYGDSSVVPLIPILAKLGGRISQFDLSFDIGYTIGVGFTLGGTVGMEAGRGVLFARVLGIPSASPFEGDGVYSLQSGMMGFVGYKVGVGN
jgi:TolB-like protein